MTAFTLNLHYESFVIRYGYKCCYFWYLISSFCYHLVIRINIKYLPNNKVLLYKLSCWLFIIIVNSIKVVRTASLRHVIWKSAHWSIFLENFQLKLITRPIFSCRVFIEAHRYHVNLSILWHISWRHQSNYFDYMISIKRIYCHNNCRISRINLFSSHSNDFLIID